MVHWRREWQTTSVFLSWEPHEQYEKANRTLKDELPRSVGAQYTTGDQWRNNSRKNEEMEPKQKQALGVGDGQEDLVCYSPWDHKESDTTEWLNWLTEVTELKNTIIELKNTLKGFNNSLDEEVRVSDLKEKTMEPIKTKQKKNRFPWKRREKSPEK